VIFFTQILPRRDSISAGNENLTFLLSYLMESSTFNPPLEFHVLTGSWLEEKLKLKFSGPGEV